MTDTISTPQIVPDEVIEDTAEHVFHTFRIGGYAKTAFKDLPKETQEFWRSVVRTTLARALARPHGPAAAHNTASQDGEVSDG